MNITETWGLVDLKWEIVVWLEPGCDEKQNAPQVLCVFVIFDNFVDSFLSKLVKEVDNLVDDLLVAAEEMHHLNKDQNNQIVLVLADFLISTSWYKKFDESGKCYFRRNLLHEKAKVHSYYLRDLQSVKEPEISGNEVDLQLYVSLEWKSEVVLFLPSLIMSLFMS